MSAVPRLHLDENTVESYALGRLSQQEESFVEEHLLICEQCRRQVEREDDFLRAFRMADERIRKAEAARPGPWVKRLLRLRPLHLSAALAVCCLVVIAYRHPAADFNASLVATRGAFDSVQTVAAGAKLNLTLDLRGLPAAEAVVAELAAADGSVLWTATERNAGEAITVRPGVTVKPGLYWLRLYSATSSRALLREFGIRAK